MSPTNAESSKRLEPQNIYSMQENEEKHQYSMRVLGIEHGWWTPLLFTTTGGMGQDRDITAKFS